MAFLAKPFLAKPQNLICEVACEQRIAGRVHAQFTHTGDSLLWHIWVRRMGCVCIVIHMVVHHVIWMYTRVHLSLVSLSAERHLNIGKRLERA